MFERRRLEAELAHWRRAGQRPQLWWRDDDAQRLSAPLARLLDQCVRSGAPLTLAVVPIGADSGLAEHLKAFATVSIAQHGFDHRNARSAERPSQFCDHASVDEVAAAIGAGAQALEGFARALPIYVPPWNAIQPNVQAALERLSMSGLSAFGEPAAAGAPSRVDVHLDLMRWGERPRFLGRERFLARLRRLLSKRRQTGRWDEPIGLLTHHLDHDEAAWAFLGRLMAWKPLRAVACWRSADELFACADRMDQLARKAS